jgi:hypothetical protein
MKDKRLEELSDKVRQGIPIPMMDAIEVINYQEGLRREREALPWYKRIFKILLGSH